MRIRDAYLHGADLNGVVKSISLSKDNLTYTKADAGGNTVNVSIPTWNQSTTGNAATSTYASNVGTSAANLSYQNLKDVYDWWHTSADGDGAHDAIENWKEVERFLTGITDEKTLSGLLALRVAKAGDTMSGALTINNKLTVTGVSSLQGISGTTLNISGAATFSTPINGDLLGNATTADRLKLTEAVGSASLPVYFSGGLPVACTASSVFSSLTTNTTNAVSMTVAGLTRNITAADMKTSLGLGSNAYSSTAYLPLAGGTVTGKTTFNNTLATGSDSQSDKGVFINRGTSELEGCQLYVDDTGLNIINRLDEASSVINFTFNATDTENGNAGANAFSNKTATMTANKNGIVLSGLSLTGNVTGNVSGSSASCTGNAETATTLKTSRNLWGNSFNGSADISGNITFPDSTFSSNPTDSNGLIWSGGTDGAKIFYRQTASNAGSLVLQVSDDGEEYIQFRHSKGGTVYLTPNTKEFYPDTTNTGSLGTSTYKWANVYATTFNGALSGNASSASKVLINQHTGNNVNYPIVWTNTTGTTTGNTDLYKSGALLYFNSNSYKLTSIGGFIGNSLDINGTADIDSLTAGNLTVTGASTLTGDVSLGTVKSGTWLGGVIANGYIASALTGKTYNGYTLAGACAKAVDTSIAASSTSTNLPTSAAVAAFVEGKGYLTSHSYGYGAFDIYNSSGAKKTSNETVSASVNNETLRLKEGANIAITATQGTNAGEDVVLIAVTGITSNIDRNGYGKLALWHNGASAVSATLESATYNDKLTVKAGTGIEFSESSGAANADIWTISAIPYNNASELTTKTAKSLVKSSWTNDANSIFLTSNGASGGTALTAGTYAIYIEDRSSADGTPNYYSGVFVCAGGATNGRLDEIALHSSMATATDTDSPTRIFAATEISGTSGKHCLRFSSLDASAANHYLTVKVNRLI